MIYSCISYPGSKRKCLDLIMDLIPEGVTDWREPFMGSLSVTLGFLQSEKSRDCKRYVVGDLAPEIWALWAGIQRDSKKVCDIATDWWNTNIPTYEKLNTYSLSEEERAVLFKQFEEEGRAFWKWTQEVDCSQLSLEERAARTWLVNRISFSSMGDSGSLSVDRFEAFKLHHLNKVREVAPLLQNLEIINATFQKTMENVPVEGGFVFLDPPYANQEKSGLYGRGGDTHHKFPHKEFAEFCKGTKAKWLITYDDSIVVRKLFRERSIYKKPFKIVYTMAMKNAEDALDGEELFLANYDIMNNESFDSLKDILGNK